MAVSTWTWVGGSGVSTVVGAWALTSGAGNPPDCRNLVMSLL